MKALIPLAAAALLLAGCGTSAADRASQSASAADRASQSASANVSASGGAAYPAEVNSCGKPIKFDKKPENILILGGTSLSNLDALGLTDQLDLRAGTKNFGTGQEALQAKYDAIKEVSSSEIETGGVKVATEIVLENKVDLVIGYEEGVDREALEKAGVQLYSPAAFCPNYPVQKAGWELIDQEVRNLAAIFGVPEKAKEVAADRAKSVESLKATANEKGTGVALYITPGSPNFYAYGTSSMVQPIFEANGLKNSYDDNTTRVFDASMEDILARNPDWLVLLALDASEEETLTAFKSFQGADKLKAVADNKVVVLPFALTDPPTMLSIQGATALSEKLASK